MQNKARLKAEAHRWIERFFFEGANVSFSRIQDPWVRDLVSGVLRTFGRIDAFFEQQSTSALRPAMRVLLAVAAYQVRYQTSVRAKTVRDEGIAQARSLMGEGGARLFSALIRKWEASHEEWWTRPWPKDEEAAARWGSVSTFYFKECVRDRGRAWTEAYLESTFDRPSTWCASPSTSLSENKVFEPCAHLNTAFRYTGDQLGVDLEQYGMMVQDLSNQILVDRVVQALPPSLRVLDYCAAPGGKSIALAWRGYSCVASDVNVRRMGRLRENIERLKLTSKVQVLEQEQLEGAFDLIWLDLPCTSSGLIRRHPDIRWRLGQTELQDCLELQQRIIQEVFERFQSQAQWVVLSTCSVFLAEGEKLISQCAPYEAQWTELFRDSDGIFGALLKLDAPK